MQSKMTGISLVPFTEDFFQKRWSPPIGLAAYPNLFDASVRRVTTDRLSSAELIPYRICYQGDKSCFGAKKREKCVIFADFSCLMPQKAVSCAAKTFGYFDVIPAFTSHRGP